MKLIIVGSGVDTHIRLNSQYVSNYHAEILLLDNGEMLLTDKGSKNGTFINNQRLQPNKDIQIKRGDLIRFADVLLDWKSVPSIPMPDINKIKEMRGVGTNFRNKYQIQGEKVSRYHATLIRKNNNNWFIVDHSRNGTTVNGEKITSNKEYKLKRGDKILCAGVPIENPCVTNKIFNTKRILFIILGIFVLCGISFMVVKLINQNKISNKLDITEFNNKIGKEVLKDEDIYQTYKNSTVMLIGFYYYHVSAGNLNLENLGLATDVVIANNNLQSVDNKRSNMHSFTGTGFYVSEDGKIVTNLHIVRPWLFDKEMSLIADWYRMRIAEFATQMPELNAFTAQIKVEGVMDYIGMTPNGSYFSNENIKQCKELIADDSNIEKDIALIQLETRKMHDPNATFVDLNLAIINDDEILVGSHIYTMGFPFGLGIQDLKKEIKLLGQNGSITQECSEYSFGFNAPSYNGASGSPIFNDKGQLIGILNSGVTKSQGFNYAIKAKHVKDMLDKTN